MRKLAMSRARLLLLFAWLLMPCGNCHAQDGVIFDAGFYNEESLKDQSWRWMAEEGIVKLKNQRRDMILILSGRPALDALPAKPTMKVFLNGELLEQFDPTEKTFEKEYKIPAAKLGNGAWVDLRITTSKVIIPSEINNKSSDGRHLGFKLHKLTWAAAAGAEPLPVPEQAEPPPRSWLMAFLLIGAGFVFFSAVALAAAFFLLKGRSAGKSVR
jgi:hypothetical protein